MASLRPAARLTAAAAAVTVLAGGCATIPTVGLPQAVVSASGQAQPYVQPIPPVPQPGWLAPEVVLGFLAASAAVDHAGALRFLDSHLRRTWKPSWAVTVVSGPPKLQTTKFHRAELEDEPTNVATVTLAGHQLATISDIGQYLGRPGEQSYQFTLRQVNGQWLITSLPRQSLLLTQADFEEAYQPRNLYFWAPHDRALVPEPIFAPQGKTNSSVATVLVNGLLPKNQNQSQGQNPAQSEVPIRNETQTQTQGQDSWLGAATQTDFPPGTTLRGPVAVTGSTATVNLGGAAARARPQQLRHMAAQLVTTLAGNSYGQTPIVSSVVLETNGRPREIGGHQAQQLPAYLSLVPGAQPPPAGLYFISSNHQVSQMIAPSGPRPVPGPVGRRAVPFTSIAVSPGGYPQLAGTVASAAGCVIDYGPLSGIRPLSHLTLPGSAPCGSLSWDSSGNLWAVAGQGVWVLQSGARLPLPVKPPPLPYRYRVLALRVAPDGVRVAMLIKSRDGVRHLMLTAISRSGAESFGSPVAVGASVNGPTALSWYDADHLVVLAGSELWQVPANGGTATPLGIVPPGTTSVTAAGPGQLATQSQGQILTSFDSSQAQASAAKGTSPVYPG